MISFSCLSDSLFSDKYVYFSEHLKLQVKKCNLCSHTIPMRNDFAFVKRFEIVLLIKSLFAITFVKRLTIDIVRQYSLHHASVCSYIYKLHIFTHQFAYSTILATMPDPLRQLNVVDELCIRYVQNLYKDYQLHLLNFWHHRKQRE